LISNNIC